MRTRIGIGYDVHRLDEKRALWLGGINIPHYKGAVAHSDGDALIHSICDALLGAAHLRDIGFHFPDTSNEYKNIDSKILLSKTVQLLHEKGFAIGNIDCIICLQKPKVSEYIAKMQQKLATVLKISEEDISIKATTTEMLGFVGREEGIACYTVAIIEKI